MALGDIQIVQVRYPSIALPGSQPTIDVDVQFYKSLNNWYCRILDIESGGIPFVPHEAIGFFDVGSVHTAHCPTRSNYYMLNKPWLLKVEIGIMDWVGRPAYPTDYEFITIYPEQPPETCPAGYTYDPVKGACVPYEDKTRGLDPIVVGASAIMLSLAISSYIYSLKKKPRG